MAEEKKKLTESLEENNGAKERFTVTVLEDDEREQKKLKEYLEKFGSENNVVFCVKVFSSVKEFEEGYEKSDLVLVDIELPDGNGFKVSESLRKKDESVMIIFVTNMAQYAVKGYEVEAFDFIVKPISYYGFSVKTERAMVKLRATKKEKDKTIVLKTVNSVITLAVSDILYVEVIGHSLVYHTVNGDFDVYGTMQKAAEDLGEAQFEFCNRCYLVNLAHVESVKGYECRLKNVSLQMSRLKKKFFMEKLNNYYAFGDKD